MKTFVASVSALALALLLILGGVVGAPIGSRVAAKLPGVVLRGLMAVLVLPLSGWAMSSSFSQGKPVSLFGLIDFPALPVPYDKATEGLFHETHEITAWAMIVLVVIHVAAALKHRIIDKDETLQRMAPWMR